MADSSSLIAFLVYISFPIAIGLTGLFVEKVTVEECREGMLTGYTLQLSSIVVISLMIDLLVFTGVSNESKMKGAAFFCLAIIYVVLILLL